MTGTEPVPGGLELYRRLLNYGLPYWKIFLLAVGAMLLYAATDTGFAALMKPLLDGNFIDRDPAVIKMVPLALIGLFLFRGLSGFVSRYAMTWIGRNIIHTLRNEMYQRLLHLPCRYYDRQAAGHLLSRLTYDVEQVAEASTNTVTILIRDSLTLLFLLAYMFWVSSWMTLLFLVTGPVIVMLIRYASHRFRKISLHIQQSMGYLTQFVEQTISGQKTIKAFGADTQQAQLFASLNQHNRALHLKMALVNSLNAPLVQLVAACMLALVIYLATRQSIAEQISVGEFVSFITAMMLIMQPVKRLTNINASLQRGIAAAQSIFSLLDEIPESDQGHKRLSRAEGSISFEEVSFEYAENSVLKHINLSIDAGQSVAIVGRSGSGKSTLAELVLRFYEPSKGVIRLDGTDIRDYQLSDLRRQIAIVGQDALLFNDTLANNIAFGSSPRTDPGAIEAAAVSAHAMEFIQALPDGLQTRVGDRGILLSGGQRQRIAIARAILKDAPILILDEATSSLDSESERHVQAAIQALRRDRTALIIAHRLSTVENADRIFVLDEGGIVESGSHRELMQKQGLYAELYRLHFDADPVC